ncbi:MAG: SUMF1/EgtB/PvdO family nonheme iron enzyme [Akkermansia sp.]
MGALPPQSPIPSIPLGRVMRPTPQIPDHEVVRQIGSGAYGEVWLAKSLTGAWRAVKIVWREDFDDERTFNREFEGIERYEPIARNHPGLVHILHVGRKEAPENFYYYVMELGDDAQNGIHINPAEYIPRTLQTDKKLADGKPLPLDYCLEVGSQLAHSLVYLHSKELTHRDIKPTNVIFVNGRPKLADIGLVALRDQRSFVGTEGFIPPEGPGTKRADVYALAKVLYEISTGKDRLDFPELPDNLPPETPKKKWQIFNTIICAAAEPRADKCAIDTAERLAEALDTQRGYTLHPKFKRPRKKRRLSSTSKILLSAFLGGVISIFAVTLFSNYWSSLNFYKLASPTIQPQEAPKVPNDQHQQTASQQPQTQERQGYLFISSIPSGASIYDANNRYLDETPYGPIPCPANQTVSYIIKKDGYADWTESGVIPDQGTLSLGGVLNAYHPPVEGEYWIDSEKMRYIPNGTEHKAESPLPAKSFRHFLSSRIKSESFPHQIIPESDKKNAPSIVLTTPDGIRNYLGWLADQCEKDGLLGKEFSLSAESLAGYSDEKDNLHAYRLIVSKVHQVPITILTEPTGASIFLNGILIGHSPLEKFFIPQAPYELEIKLSGHAGMKRSGLNPTDLYLSLQLEQNQSVIFSDHWQNSLGMEFIPISPDIMAQSREVRVSDYQLFIKDTHQVPPPPLKFKQSPEHPVVNVSRQNAINFAHWLTNKERQQGIIEITDEYRLPSDGEWSQLVGLDEKADASPYLRSCEAAKKATQYFWGTQWPPPMKTGNFADKSALTYLPSSRIILNYEDDAPHTSKVGSYAANNKGFFDLDGNVQEWVADSFGGDDNTKFNNYAVARGGNYLSFRPHHLDKTVRTPLPETSIDPTIGFRLMLIRQDKKIQDENPSPSKEPQKSSN